MPEKDKPGSDLVSTLENNNYPSDLDKMPRNDTPYEGTETSMPSESPLAGKVKSSTYSNVIE